MPPLSVCCSSALLLSSALLCLQLHFTWCLLALLLLLICSLHNICSCCLPGNQSSVSAAHLLSALLAAACLLDLQLQINLLLTCSASHTLSPHTDSFCISCFTFTGLHLFAGLQAATDINVWHSFVLLCFSPLCLDLLILRPEINVCFLLPDYTYNCSMFCKVCNDFELHSYNTKNLFIHLFWRLLA